MMLHGNIYIIPVLLGGNDVAALIPKGTGDVIFQLQHFIVENEKSARQFLKLCGTAVTQQDLHIIVLDKHADQNYEELLQPAMDGHNIGLLSEAGAPAVADPGATIVNAAHRLNLKVIPLTGPSSILLSLMASGLNGQSFCFHGYLPIEKEGRLKKLKLMEKDAQLRNQTQIFIETPYRNNSMMKFLKDHLSPQTRLCIAAAITLQDEYIKTRPMHQWAQFPDLNKKPCVFLFL